MNRPPVTVTILIPALNEERDITGCLEAVAAQSYPRELVDVVLVDGCSDDATVEITRTAAAGLGLSLSVFENPARRTSSSLNLGLQHLRGEIVVRLDARSRVQPAYVETCVDVLTAQPEVGVVGGRQVPLPRSSTLTDRGIARALSNRYTTGFARYRRASVEGPADTVWMGVFRADDLRKLGGWNDEVALNEDWVLNRSYRDAGWLVWFVPTLVSGYLPRTDLTALARQHFNFGRVKGLWWMRGMKPEPRQLAVLTVPLIAGVTVLAMARRRGAGVMVAVPVGLLLADAIGCDEPAEPATRCVSATAIGIYAGSWWIGTIAGSVGELLGIEHPHRSAAS